MTVPSITRATVVQQLLELLAASVLLRITTENELNSATMRTHFQMTQLVIQRVKPILTPIKTLRQVRPQHIIGERQTRRKTGSLLLSLRLRRNHRVRACFDLPGNALPLLLRVTENRIAANNMPQSGQNRLDTGSLRVHQLHNLPAHLLLQHLRVQRRKLRVTTARGSQDYSAPVLGIQVVHEIVQALILWNEIDPGQRVQHFATASSRKIGTPTQPFSTRPHVRSRCSADSGRTGT